MTSQPQPSPLTDPRILAIMASLQQPDEEAQEEKPTGPVLPPTTPAEWMKMEKLEEWPLRITSEGPLHLEDEELLFSGKEDIVDELRKHAPLSMGLLDQFEQKLDELEIKLDQYAQHILDDDHRPSRLAEGLFHTPSDVFLTEVVEKNAAVQTHHSRRRKKKQTLAEAMQASRSKSIQYASFPGFRAAELLDLPQQLEAPQVMDRVTKAQDFNPGFKKLWKKLFLSEASVAVMQDTFWWYFLEKFEKNRPEDQDRLFNRIADSFVALFMSVHPDVRDKYFKVYADCLAQSIYAAFAEAFPESQDKFDERFIKDLINIISEWISGTRPPPESWRKWNLKRLRPKSPTAMADDEHSKQKSMMAAATSLTKTVNFNLNFDMSDLRDISRLGKADQARVATGTTATQSPVKARELPSRSTRVGTQGGVTTESRIATVSTPKLQPIESHQTGPGPQFERVTFNLSGRSPLVSHYLQMKSLEERETRDLVGRRVRRTEVKKLPPPGPTYRDVIRESLEMTKTLQDEYKKICEITAQERMRIERQRRDAVKQIEKLKHDLSKQSWEMKVFTEKVHDKRKQREMFKPRGRDREWMDGGETEEEEEEDEEEGEEEEGPAEGEVKEEEEKEEEEEEKRVPVVQITEEEVRSARGSAQSRKSAGFYS
ncbi:PREDICTED: protein FAM227B-like [Branchiostoma belcheri]|uniref:Protein FAM227B-like n=1 Tax=Branchiostoma belcheri TaxID=7741 RepID=A0A6P4YRG8_BRABE|nr:PREDICTED: protein FAM227B-like [Branchiostoma belcheri]